MDSPAIPVLLSLLGPSGSGKTSLAAGLVGRWSDLGLRVGFAKHASHGFQMDREGKDTERVARAGGAGVAVTGPSGTGYVDGGEESTPRDLALRFFPTCQVVLLEGFRESALPAVVLTGDRNSTEFIDLARGKLLAVITAPEGDAAEAAKARSTPRFEPDDLTGLAAHLEAALDLPVGR